jgi:hypothetical protein
MTNRYKYLLPILAVVLLCSSCGKKNNEESLEKKKEMALATFANEGNETPPHPAPLPKGQKLDVPDAVKAKFHTVKMAVANRKTKEEKVFNVRIGDEVDVPGSPYKIKIIAYLPHWVIRGNTVTSNGIIPDDPAVRAIIYEGGKPVFDGYIFEKHKTPSFVSEKYVMTLTGAS